MNKATSKAKKKVGGMEHLPTINVPSEEGKQDQREPSGIPEQAWKRRLLDEFKPHKEFDV